MSSMNVQTQHKIFAKSITEQFISNITGEGVERVEGKVPEDKFIVGQLAPISTNAVSFITSRVIINGVGVNFNNI